MKKVNNKKIYFALVFNILIVILEAFSLILSFNQHGSGMFYFYTEDSNIFTFITCLILSIFIIRYLMTGKKIPDCVKMLRYMATCCLAVTFIVVISILSPMYGPEGYEIMLFHDSMLYHHLLCPLLSIISFIFFEDSILSKRSAIYAVIPTIIYAVILLILNLFRLYVGPYPFLHVYEQPIYMSFIWFILILGGAYLIALILKALKRKI